VGAESVIRKVGWRSRMLVAKHRDTKRYRRPEIDARIRTQRTEHEARTLLRLADLGLPVPSIIFIDQANNIIYMQMIEGVELRTGLNESGNDPSQLAAKLGELAATMHLSGIAHGDLTLSNVLVDKRNTLWLVDLGLGLFTEQVEDMAIDIHLLERSLDSTHPSLRAEFMSHFWSGYRRVAGEAFSNQAMRKIQEVRKRGRYVLRTGG